MSRLTGFYGPRTATGKASLLPAPPWHYSGDLLTIEFRIDPDRVAELLPEPLALADEDPGPWHSSGLTGSPARPIALSWPTRSAAQYKEAFVVVRCQFEGRTYSRCVYIWVDTDFAIARGAYQGYPKKLGSIHQTRPHPFGPAPRIAAGGVFGASLAASDRRLAEARITLTRETETNGFVNAHTMAHDRLATDIAAPSAFALDEIISTGAEEFEAGPAWAADVDHFELFASPTGGARIGSSVDEIIGGYYRQVGVVWDGGELIHSRPDGRGARMSTQATVAGVEVDTRHWISGERVASAETFTDVSPIDETALARDLSRRRRRGRRAVAAARAAFPAWAALPSAERAAILRRVADGIDARAEDLARVETRDNGSLLRSHRRGVMPRVAMNFRYFADHLPSSSTTRTARSADTASGHLRPGRRRRDHHAVERAADARHLADRPRPCRRQHRGGSSHRSGRR